MFVLITMKSIFLMSLTFFFNSIYSQNWQPKALGEFGGKYAYFDSSGNKIKVFWHFDDARPFKYGLATARVKGSWGAFDSSGVVLIPFNFSSVILVNDSMAKVDMVEAHDEEYFYFRGSLKGRLYFKTEGENNYDYVIVSKSKLQQVKIIDSDNEEKIVAKLMEEAEYKYMSSLMGSNHKQFNSLWNIYNLNTTGAESKSGNIEIKTGLLFRNKFILSGPVLSFQRTKANFDTVEYINRQIPLYWSNLIFLKRNPYGTSLYSRLDLGLLITEYSYMTRKMKTGNKVKYAYYPAPEASKILINIGFGVKLSDKDRKAGLILEMGYKYLPLRIPYLKQENFIYFSIGGLL